MYEARHVLLNLRTPLVKPDIPATYFAQKEQIGEITYRKSLAEILQQFPESPLTPGIPTSLYANNSPFSQLKKLSNNNNNVPMGFGINTHLTSSAGLNRYQLQQCQQQFMMNPNDARLFQTSASSSTSLSSRPNLSPGLGRTSSCGNTSGYGSFTNSNNSLDQLYPHQQNNMQTPTHSMSGQYSPETTQFMSASQRHFSDYAGGSQMFDSSLLSSYYDNLAMVINN